MVEVKNLHIEFDGEVVHENLSFKVSKGEKLAITGGSGTGKSTILNAITGFIPKYKGDIVIDGIELNAKNVAKIRSKLAWLPQDTSLNVKTVDDLFYAPFDLYLNKRKRPTKEKISSIFDAFELSMDLLSKDTKDISGGQKQRVILASCILLNKPLLLIDEPTSALDKTIKEKVTDYILSINKLTILAVTHDEYWMRKSDSVIKL